MTRDLIEEFAEALRTEPPSLDAAATADLVARALARADDDALLDAFAGALRDAPAPEPRAIEPQGPDPKVAERQGPGRRAMERTPAPTSTGAPQRWGMAGWLAALAAAAVVTWSWWSEPPTDSAASSAPVVHHLAGGHEIVASAATQLEISETGGRVRVSLQDGEALFDVISGSDFEVHAGAAHIVVTGTVFAVGRTLEDVRVRVFEGSVRLEERGRSEALRAEEARGTGFAAGLVRRGLAAARARTGAASNMARAMSPPTLGAPDIPPPAGSPSVEVALSDEPTPAGEPATDIATPAGGATRTAQQPSRTSTHARIGAGEALRLAQRALAEQRYADAIEVLDSARSARDSTEALMLRGDAQRGLGHADEALLTYRRAMREAHGSARAVAGLEVARLLARSPDRAEEARATLVESGALGADSPVRAAATRLEARLGSP